MDALWHSSRGHVEGLFSRARAKREFADLSGLNLAGQDLSNLDFTGPAFDDKFNSQMLGVDCRHALLRHSNLEGVDLSCANLRGADLRYARLRGASLYSGMLGRALLHRADLRSVHLVSAELVDVKLEETRFSHARFGHTAIAGVDLSNAAELDQVVHVYPSPIDCDTLHRTAAGLSVASMQRRREVFHFLAGAGFVEEILAVVRGWIDKQGDPGE